MKEKKEVKEYEVNPKLYTSLYFPKDEIKKLVDLKEKMKITIDSCIEQMSYIDSQINAIIEQCHICKKCIYGQHFGFDRDGAPSRRLCAAVNAPDEVREEMVKDAAKTFVCPYFAKGYEYYKDMCSKNMGMYDYEKSIPVEERYKIDASEYHEGPVGKCNSGGGSCSHNKDGLCYRNHYPERRCSSIQTFPSYNEEWTKRWMKDRDKERGNEG